MTLRVERTLTEKPLNLRVTPRRMNPRREWLEHQRHGSRIIERDGKKIAYIPIFSLIGKEPQNLLRDLVFGGPPVGKDFRFADALLLDLRDGWGGYDREFVDFFNPYAPEFRSIRQDGRERIEDARWQKPLFLLVNGGTRSGKEMAAYVLKKHGRGTVLGERTAGAVLGGTLHELSDGSCLYLAIHDVMVDNERLEGRGVPPDVTIEDRLPYAVGGDTQLNKALEQAARATGGKSTTSTSSEP